MTTFDNVQDSDNQASDATSPEQADIDLFDAAAVWSAVDAWARKVRC